MTRTGRQQACALQGFEIDDLISKFKKSWVKADGEYIPVTGDNLIEKVARFLKSEGITRIVTDGTLRSHELSGTLSDIAESFDDISSDQFEKDSVKGVCNRAEVGIGSVETLIAETGTMVLQGAGGEQMLISSLPPVHLVIASDAQIYPTLADFLLSSKFKSGFSLITGPSRTADIEKQLVLGAHGPRMVILFGQ